MNLIYESASVILQPREGYYRVSSLYAVKTRQGHATELMKLVIDWADRNGHILVLEAKQWGNPRGLPDEMLVEFYKKFGFTSEGGRLMRRKPNRSQ